MSKLISFLIVCWLCICCAFGCLTHEIKFAYYGAGHSVAVPLKVIPIYLDKSFGEMDKLAIDDAVSQWNYALNGNIVLQVVSTSFDMEIPIIRQCMLGGCWMIMKVESDNPMVPYDPKDALSLTLAWANDVGGNRIYFVRDRIQNEWMSGIALHEMGHLLGAAHDNAYLMQPKFHWVEARCVDYDAAALVAKYWNIDMKTMRYCLYQTTK